MVTVAPALLFGLVTWLLVRERAVPGVAGVVVFLFGFFLATTGVGHVLADWLSQLMGLSGGHPVPPPAAPTSGKGIPL
jgi:hypothetical protein